MVDGPSLLLAGSAGGCVTAAALSVLAPGRAPGAREWIERRRDRSETAGFHSRARAVLDQAGLAAIRDWVGRRLELAGRHGAPEAALAAAGSAAIATGAAAGIAVGLAGGPLAGLTAALGAGVAAPVLMLQSLRAAAAERRELLLGQLVPLLELVNLELSGGAAPLVALEAVLCRARSELAAEMRAQLIGSRVAGSATFETRLLALAARLDLAPLETLAMILGLSRDFGSGAGQGIRALAADLRRARRRRVIELSRGALNKVLIPASVGILLPFMAVLLFPAVVVLLRSFGR